MPTRTGNMSAARATLAALLVLTFASSVLAQPAPTPRPSNTAPERQEKPASRLPVSLEQALYLIRSTLLTLNDANRSGNYTVLRDLAAPSFQASNTAADLAAIFAELRRGKIDLYGTALVAPRLDAPPALESNGMLRLTGAFPTRPQQIHFDMLFEIVNGHWRLFGISVGAREAQADLQISRPGAAAKNKP